MDGSQAGLTKHPGSRTSRSNVAGSPYSGLAHGDVSMEVPLNKHRSLLGRCIPSVIPSVMSASRYTALASIMPWPA